MFERKCGSDLTLFFNGAEMSWCRTVFFNGCRTVLFPAQPWMHANLKIICQFHAHPVHQNSVEIFWAEIYPRRLLFRVESSLIQLQTPDSFRIRFRTWFSLWSGYNRTLVVPYEISKVNFHITKCSCQYVGRDLIKFENINISRTS